VIVAKTPASAKKAQSFAERLRLGIAVIHGEPQEFDSDNLEDGRHSPPPQILLPANSSESGSQEPWVVAPGNECYLALIKLVVS